MSANPLFSLVPAVSSRRTAFLVDDSACAMDDLAPCGGVEVTVGGDVAWGELVQRAVTSGWPGIERLGGLPGSVADVVRDNAEIDGQTVGDAIASVGTWDRAEDVPRTFAFIECNFVPGSSRFQELLPGGEQRYDLLDVTFLFQQGEMTTPIRDPELAALLGVAVGERIRLSEYAARRPSDR